MNRYVGFFQCSDGTAHAYTVKAANEMEAEQLIAAFYAQTFSDDPGQVLCYSASDLRNLAVLLEDHTEEPDVPEHFAIIT